MWQVTRDTWHVTRDRGHIVWDEHFLKTSDGHFLDAVNSSRAKHQNYHFWELKEELERTDKN